MEVHLSDEQSDKLQQFQSITGMEDVDDCIQRLQVRGWSLEGAVNDALDLDAGAESGDRRTGKSSRGNNNESSSSAAASTSSYSATLAASSSTTAGPPATPSSSSNPTNTRDENTQSNNANRPTRLFSASGQKKSLLQLLTTPIFWGFRLLWTIFSFTGIY